jgi:hypothetical protein
MEPPSVVSDFHSCGKLLYFIGAKDIAFCDIGDRANRMDMWTNVDVAAMINGKWHVLQVMHLDASWLMH